MAREQERLHIFDYQPTEKEKAMLLEAGLTAEQVLHFDQPTAKEYESLRKYMGFGLIEAILKFSLIVNIKDLLHQVEPFTNPAYPKDNIDNEITTIQAQATRALLSYLGENPYPGKDFSREQGVLVLEAIKTTQWNSMNLPGCLTQIRQIINPPKPTVQPTPKR